VKQGTLPESVSSAFVKYRYVINFKQLCVKSGLRIQDWIRIRTEKAKIKTEEFATKKSLNIATRLDPDQNRENKNKN
jgi:hypothetical protein